MRTMMKKSVTMSGKILCFMMAMSFVLSGCQSKGKLESDRNGVSAAPESSVKQASATDDKKVKYSLYLGELENLIADDEEVLSCTSNKPEVASVSEDGVVHALKAGNAKVTVEVRPNGKKDKTDTRVCQIKVKKKGMVYPAFSMMKGEHLDLQFSLEDVQAAWKSDNEKIAKVSKKGKVTALKKGKVTLTAKAEDGKTYCCSLQVTKRIKSVIYLTFDDGPNRYTTPKVLNILKKNNVKATFFELKPAKADFDLTKRVIDEGHTLALHGYQHKYDIVYQSQKAYHDNLDLLRNLFFKKFGVWCTISRFPGGSSNIVSRYNPGIMTKLTGKLHDWGYHYFDWNVDSQDAGGARTAGDTFHNFKNSLVKGRGNVVLMHDYYKNDKTINALDKMIRYGKKQGYTFLPITASTDEVHHGVNN